MSDLALSDEELIQLKLLREEEIDKLVEQGLLNQDQRWEPELLDGFTLSYAEMHLVIKTGDSYPVQPLNFRVENVSLPRLVVDDLRIALRQTAMADSKTNRLEAWNTREESNVYGYFDFAMTALHLATQTKQFLVDYRKDAENKAELTKEVKPHEQANEEKGLDLKSVTGDALIKEIIGKTPQEICADLPEQFRILHVESVIRPDLTKRFLTQQESVREKLQTASRHDLEKCLLPSVRKKIRVNASRKEDLIQEMVRPVVTFHGTRRDFVSGIVRQGFLMPGAKDKLTGEQHALLHFRTLGLLTTVAYVPTKPTEYEGIKLIVCATVMGAVMGATRTDAWQGIDDPKKGATSHVGNTGNEYVVFHGAQILPCYVIHMDWGKDNWRFFDDIPDDPNLWVNRTKEQYAWKKLHKADWEKQVGPGGVQRAKEEQLARARKYLGYGFGAKEGSALVVEEIGEVDEDEENYGEYQADRTDHAEGGLNFWEFSLEEEDLWDNGRVNKYAEARKAMTRWKK